MSQGYIRGRDMPSPHPAIFKCPTPRIKMFTNKCPAFVKGEEITGQGGAVWICLVAWWCLP